MICKNCNAEIPYNSFFCNFCGSKVETKNDLNDSLDVTYEEVTSEEEAIGEFENDNEEVSVIEEIIECMEDDNLDKSVYLEPSPSSNDKKGILKKKRKKHIFIVIPIIGLSIFIYLNSLANKEAASPNPSPMVTANEIDTDINQYNKTVVSQISNNDEDEKENSQINIIDNRESLAKDEDLLVKLRQIYIGIVQGGGNEFHGTLTLENANYVKDNKYYIHFKYDDYYNAYVDTETLIVYWAFNDKWVNAEVLAQFNNSIANNFFNQPGHLKITISEPSHIDNIDGKEYIVAWGEVYEGDKYIDYFQLLSDVETGEIYAYDANFNLLKYDNFARNLIDKYPVKQQHSVFLPGEYLDSNIVTNRSEYSQQMIGEYFNSRYLSNLKVSKDLNTGKAHYSIEVSEDLGIAGFTSDNEVRGFEYVFFPKYQTGVFVGVIGLQLELVLYDINGNYLTSALSSELHGLYSYRNPDNLREGIIIESPLMMTTNINTMYLKEAKFATVGFVQLKETH